MKSMLVNIFLPLPRVNAQDISDDARLRRAAQYDNGRKNKCRGRTKFARGTCNIYAFALIILYSLICLIICMQNLVGLVAVGEDEVVVVEHIHYGRT